MEKIYDVLIVGGGVAGMSCAIYARRAGKTVAIIEKNSLGGTVLGLQKIENFPSQSEIDGFSLAQMFSKQVERLGVEIVCDEIVKSDLSAKILFGKNGTYKAPKIVIATGLESVTAGANETDFLGRGVSFCAVCDGNFFKNKDVCVMSRHGSGLRAARHLSHLARSVVLFDECDMSGFARADVLPTYKIVSFSRLVKVLGGDSVEAVEIMENGKKKKYAFDGVFIELGKKPKTTTFGGLEVDENGFIKTDEHMQTSIAGVYAIGDVRNGVLKQIVTACSDGAIAGV